MDLETALAPTPTTYPSFVASARSAARSRTRRGFPPGRLAAALAETIREINERPNGPRRNRTCPRKVKRYRAHSHHIKRPTDRNQVHLGLRRS